VVVGVAGSVAGSGAVGVVTGTVDKVVDVWVVGVGFGPPLPGGVVVDGPVGTEPDDADGSVDGDEVEEAVEAEVARVAPAGLVEPSGGWWSLVAGVPSCLAAGGDGDDVGSDGGPS
jgi:hypothetical protein